MATPLNGKLGFTETELKNVAESIKGKVPAGRFGEPLEIAKTVVFLSSDEGAYTRSWSTGVWAHREVGTKAHSDPALAVQR